VGKVFQDLVAEYEATETLESQVAHDADKIESLLQAVEYQAQGHDTAPWQETSIAALRTDPGKQLARAVVSADPHGWWSAFAASYRELRDTARGRARETRDARPGQD
jgi:5'-deoxynucleotidase YfbR-like HD superfamily hydrolase